MTELKNFMARYLPFFVARIQDHFASKYATCIEASFGTLRSLSKLRETRVAKTVFGVRGKGSMNIV